MNSTPFEDDIADQADALRTFLQTPTPGPLAHLASSPYDRIVLTGMGSSHSAALPTWRRLVAAGMPAWWVDTGQLLETTELVTPRTLLIATSQSGASGELVELLRRLESHRPAALIGITNEPDSPLASASDVVVDLHSGPEATVSTKSYLNSLQAHQRLSSLMTSAVADDPWESVKAVEGFRVPPVLTQLAEDYVATDRSRLVFVGFGDHSATAQYSGLITKEGAKVPAEGFIGGQFRHGPLELAGPGLTAVLFGGGEGDPARGSLAQLAVELVASGSSVLAVGALGVDGVAEIEVAVDSPTAQLTVGAVVAQHLTVAIARARGISPGTFNYGSKVTSSL